ncbi:MAG: carboxypeptidase-like regulatory domain-containing protein [Planctomycetota bacterium]
MSAAVNTGLSIATLGLGIWIGAFLTGSDGHQGARPSEGPVGTPLHTAAETEPQPYATARDLEFSDDRTSSDIRRASDSDLGKISARFEESLHGRVLDPRAEPLNNVSIEVLDRTGRRFETATDQNGEFSLDELADGPVTIRAELDGWRFRNENPKNSASGQFLHLFGEPLFDVEFEIRGPNGKSVAEAVLVVQRESESRTVRWTPGMPNMPMLADGSLVQAFARPIEPFAPPDEPYFSEWICKGQWVSSYSNPDGLVVIQLRDAPSLVVSLVSERIPRSQVRVALKSLETESASTSKLSRTRLENLELFHDLSPGAYDLGPIWSPGGTATPLGPRTRIVLNGGVERVELRTSLPTEEGWIHLQVENEAGEPVDQIRTFLRPDPAHPYEIGLAHLPLGDGAYLLHRSRVEASQFGARSGSEDIQDVRLVVRSEGSGEAITTVTDPTDRLLVRLARPADLELLVSGAPRGLRGPMALTVEVFQLDGPEEQDGRRVQQWNFSADGQIKLSRLPRSFVRVAIRASNATRRVPDLVSQVVDLREGPSSAELVIPPTYALEVECPTAERGDLFLAYRISDDAQRTRRIHARSRCVTPGTTTFTGLERGRYELQVEGQETTIQVDVPSGPVTIE